MPAPVLPTIRADAGQIEQVIMNLAVNAQDAMPEGGVMTIETRIGITDPSEKGNFQAPKLADHVTLSITDTGMGMDAKTLEKIFEPFYTTKEKGKGTGLGLSTVYGIVKQHGGSIRAFSEPGKGSRFQISFPASEPAVRDESPVDEARKGVRGSETVLLVEDNDSVRDLTAKILLRQGYVLLSASCGRDALKILENHNGSVDLLLTDVIMPDMNGRRLFERVAERYPNLKVLFMSGYTDNVIAHHGVLDEGVNFIQKPFSIQGLARKIREVLDKNT
jgi:CheY-like chemotaxis protein